MAYEIVKCRRCGKHIDETYAEACWYCDSYLCYRCWEKYGHCGHWEADKINEMAREGFVFPVSMLEVIAIAKKYGAKGLEDLRSGHQTNTNG